MQIFWCFKNKICSRLVFIMTVRDR